MAKPMAVVALFTGDSPNNIQLVGVTVDETVTTNVAQALLDRQEASSANPVSEALNAGRREALTRLIQTEPEH